ncbi:MAG: transglycosylase domain-containing protein, partial [Chloroflexota bacterium]|nr:transglycosylase domain-containing protein [Chloroflexota bacterium]
MTFLAAILVAGGAVAALRTLPRPDPALDTILGTSPDLRRAVRKGLSEPTRVVAADGSVIGQFRPEERFVAIAPEDIPDAVLRAVLAAEDTAFLQHAGIDAEAILRASLANLKGGSVEQGGSTITQQLVKNLFTSGDQTLQRKLDEAKIALQLERDYTKREILAAYLNTVFFGEGAVGVRAAARTYFRKPVAQLNLSEAALLAGIIPAPSVSNPRVDPEGAEERRLRVLDRLAGSGLASLEEVEAARSQPPVVHPRPPDVARYPYFMDYVRRWLLERAGLPADMLYRGGLTVETTLDPSLQEASLATVHAHLPAPDDPSASVVVIDPSSGAVRALVGGRDWGREQVNLALGSFGGGSGRQPGSSFKPFILALAFERGASPLDVVPAPAEWPVEEGHVVHNYSRRGYGEVTLAEAARRSINTSFVATALSLGVADVATLSRSFGLKGIPQPEEVGASLAVGAYEVAPLRMAAAYGAFAANGRRVDPRPVTRVIGPDGLVQHHWPGHPGPVVIGDETARLVTDTLRGVITAGTGTAADFGRPAAGKTGTTDDYRDAWFIGYTPQLVASVWVGYTDGNRPMLDVEGVARVTGGSIPARIWRDVMSVAHADLPVADFPPPPERAPPP